MPPRSAVLRTRRATIAGAAALVLLAVAGAVTTADVAAAKPPRALGDSRVIAQLPPEPGYPEGVAVRDGRVYVATAARFGTSVVPPLDPPEVQVFERASGDLVATHVVLDDDETRDHGLSGVAFDSAGRLYVLSTQWGIVRFDPATAPAVIDPNNSDHYSAFVYASAFPDLPPCPPVPAPGQQCSPGPTDAPSLPNDLAFDAAGNLYVTDSLQATIWRVPPPTAPGLPSAPQIWLQDIRLAGAFGPNGIRFDASGTVLYLTVTADLTGHGHVYRVDLDANPALEIGPFHTYLAAEVIDNLAFGRSGRLYVALAGTNQIQVLAPDGTELARYAGPAVRADGTTVPYDMPSGVALDSATKSLLVNNHSEVLGLPDRFVVFDVFVDDRAEPLIRPVVA